MRLIAPSSQYYGRLHVVFVFYPGNNVLLITFFLKISQAVPWFSWVSISYAHIRDRLFTCCFQVNFIQQPLPKGSKTGAGGKNGVSGALGQKQETSTGLTTLMQFW